MYIASTKLTKSTALNNLQTILKACSCKPLAAKLAGALHACFATTATTTLYALCEPKNVFLIVEQS